MDKVTFDDSRLNTPYGEDKRLSYKPADEVRCLANGTEGSWVDRYRWEPQNGTKYDLVYGCRMRESAYGDGPEFMLVYVNPFSGERCGAMLFSDSHIRWDQVMEHLAVNQADAAGILGFLKLMGHAVGYPRPMAVGD